MRLALVVTATVLAHAAFNGSRVTVSLYALSLGATPLLVGGLMSLYAALPMFLGVKAGRHVDRVGVRTPIIAAVALIALAVALPGVFPGLTTLFFAAAAIGCGFMLFHICVQHLVGEMSAPDVRQANFGWLALGFSISGFLGPTLAGFAIDAIGHGSTFLFLSTLALASFGLLFSQRAKLAHTPHATNEATQRGTFDLLSDIELRRIFIVTGLLASAWDLFIFVMPIYGTAIGLSASTIGLILGSFALATFVVRLALPWLTRRWREWQMITGTLCVACVAYALFPVMRTVPFIAAIAFLLGLGLGATQPALLALIYATAPTGRAAEAVGIRSTVLNGSHTILPLTFGGVSTFLGMAPVFWTMAGLLAAGGWFANRRRRALA
jgi:predicted MFS family arabinose efflux permease